jgi:hypothetical protein
LCLAFPKHFQKCLQKPLKAFLPLLKAFENALYVRSCCSVEGDCGPYSREVWWPDDSVFEESAAAGVTRRRP